MMMNGSKRVVKNYGKGQEGSPGGFMNKNTLSSLKLKANESFQAVNGNKEVDIYGT